MAINLLNIQPHKVSRDLSGYITFIYGQPKCGKTTFATQMPSHLLLAFEKGYNALPGVIAQDVNSWGEMKSVLRELKKPEVQQTFKSVIIDTVDIAAELCQKYICQQLNIENVGDGGFTNNGWSKYKKEFEDTFRTLTMLGYAVVFISHVKRTENNKTGEVTIKPSTQSSALAIIENMADLYGYAHPVKQNDGSSKVVLTLRGPDGVSCGGRFKYIDNEVDFNYPAVAKALTDAIDREAKAHDNKFVTDAREVATVQKEYDYDAMIADFNNITNDLMTKDKAYYGPRIIQIIERYLGKGKKVGDTTRDQAELVYLINSDIRAELIEAKA